MEAPVETLPAVAKVLREWMPQLLGRAIPVTEVLVTKENMPQLPIAIVAPIVQNFTQANGGYRMTVAEDFAIAIWLPPERETNDKGGETPFWSYYPYNKLRDQLFSNFAAWRSPQGGTVRFISMDVDCNFLATVLTFRLRATYDICADDGEVEGPAVITFTLCQPATPECEPPCEEQEKDPCHVST